MFLSPAKDIHILFRYFKTLCDDTCSCPTIAHDDTVYSFNIFPCSSWDRTSCRVPANHCGGLAPSSLLRVWNLLPTFSQSYNSVRHFPDSDAWAALMLFALKSFRKRYGITARCSNFSMSTDDYARAIAMICWKWTAETIVMKLCTHNHKMLSFNVNKRYFPCLSPSYLDRKLFSHPSYILYIFVFAQIWGKCEGTDYSWVNINVGTWPHGP